MNETQKQRYSFTEEGFVDREIELTGLSDSEFEAYAVIFAAPVSLKNCSFRSFQVEGGAFQRGLDLTNCNFANPFYFFAGGHNMYGSHIRIQGCVFHAFADFGDCWFEGPFEVIDCDFREGTNLLGNADTPIQVTYDDAPVFTRVKGKLDVDDYKART